MTWAAFYQAMKRGISDRAVAGRRVGSSGGAATATQRGTTTQAEPAAAKIRPREEKPTFDTWDFLFLDVSEV
jgi:hypothetical protein